VQRSQDPSRSPVPLLGEPLDATPFDRHQGELTGDEEPIEGNQDANGDEADEDTDSQT